MLFCWKGTLGACWESVIFTTQTFYTLCKNKNAHWSNVLGISRSYVPADLVCLKHVTVHWPAKAFVTGSHIRPWCTIKWKDAMIHVEEKREDILTWRNLTVELWLLYLEGKGHLDCEIKPGHKQHSAIFRDVIRVKKQNKRKKQQNRWTQKIPSTLCFIGLSSRKKQQQKTTMQKCFLTWTLYSSKRDTGFADWVDCKGIFNSRLL